MPAIHFPHRSDQRCCFADAAAARPNARRGPATCVRTAHIKPCQTAEESVPGILVARAQPPMNEILAVAGAPNGVQNDQVKVNGPSSGLVRIAFAEDEAEEVLRGSGAVSLPYRRHTNIAADRLSNWMHTTISAGRASPGP